MDNLDLIDRKILHELDFNSRQPISIISKKLKISRDIINYRIQRFVKERLLMKFYTIIDISKLGYAVHKNFIRFQDITERAEKKFISYIEKNQNIVYSASYDGKFDIVVSIWAKNIEDLANYIHDMDAKFGRFISERQMATIIKGEYCVRDYLIDKKTFTKRQYFFGSVSHPEKIDDIDKGILLELGKNARISVVDIAFKLKLSADAISKRIKKLEKTGIIQNYNIVPNEENYPFTHYKILVSLNNLNELQEKKLEDYCRQQKSIWYFCKVLGPWNFEIDLDVKTKEEFREILRDFKVSFSEVIKDYTVLTAFKTNKYNFCPRIP